MLDRVLGPVVPPLSNNGAVPVLVSVRAPIGRAAFQLLYQLLSAIGRPPFRLLYRLLGPDLRFP